MGRLEPDLVDPSMRPAFYVEAKQYGDSRNAKRNLIRSVAQVQDTVGRLIGTPYECQEAFIVVFRVGGPRYSLPRSLQGDGWVTHLTLIDLAIQADETLWGSVSVWVVMGVLGTEHISVARLTESQRRLSRDRRIDL